MIDYLKENGWDILWKIFLAVLVFVVAYTISKKIVAKIRARIEANSAQQTPEYAKKLSWIVWTMIFVLLMIFTLLAVFQVIGVDVALLMWGISLGLGFAMETTITDMISGIFLMTNQKVKLWDYVKFLWDMNLMGTIDEINIRYTVIKTFDKRRVIVPNSVVAQTPVQTYKSEPLVRGEIAFTLSRHVLFPQVKEIMLKLINAHKAVAHKEYSNVLISWFDTFGIQIKSYFFVDQTIKGASAYTVWRDLKKKIFEEFKKYGISIPYEHLTLTVE
jgi:small-conductance mechanosensitive channel